MPGLKTAWVKIAKQLLCEALWDWGIGGKTSSGYGRLVYGAAGGSGKSSALPLQAAVKKFQSNDVCDTEIVDVNAKGTLIVQIVDTTIRGPVTNHREIPEEFRKKGTKLQLRVNSEVKGIPVNFRYVDTADEEKRRKQGGKANQRKGKK